MDYDELFSYAWSNELINSKEDIIQLFGAHFPGKFFLWEVLKNEKDSKIKIK